MQGRTQFQQQKLQTYEIRQNQYQNTWKVPMMDTVLKKPLCELLLSRDQQGRSSGAYIEMNGENGADR